MRLLILWVSSLCPALAVAALPGFPEAGAPRAPPHWRSDGVVQLILYGSEKAFGGSGGGIVVDGSGVDVGDFLVEATLTSADFANALQQLIEIILTKRFALLEPFVVHHEASR